MYMVKRFETCVIKISGRRAKSEHYSIDDYSRNNSNIFCGISVPLVLDDYSSYGYPSTKLCPLEGPCDCESHYMVANFDGFIFCINTFFLPNGDVNVFPVCDAACCSTSCG